MTEKISNLIKLTRIAFFCFILVIVSRDASAQAFPYTNQIREPLVKIGEKFPDFEFVISDHRMRKARISDFRGKVVVLDLMTNRCPSCINMLPELDSIRKLVAKEAEIISIVPEDSVTMTQAVHHLIKGKFRKFPFVYNDKIFHQLFPFDRVPAFVWIDREGILRAITRSDYCITENIVDLAAGKSVNWEMAVNKRDPNLKYPLMQLYRVASDVKFYSMVTRELKNYNLTGGIYLDTGKNKRLSIVNLPISGLYPIALRRSAIVDSNTPIFFECNLPSLKQFKYEHEYLAATSFCYESTFPVNTSDKEMHLAMLSDLNRYFNLYGHVEKRELWCVVIKDINPGKRIRKQIRVADNSQQTISVADLAHLYAAAASRREYRTLVKSDTFVKKYPMPVIVETQHGFVNVVILRGALQRGAAYIKEQLASNGFKVVEERRMMKVGVVSYRETTRPNFSGQK